MNRVRNPFARMWAGFKARVSTRIVSLTIPNWSANNLRPDYFDRTFENFVREGYKRNEIIYACINATADTAASVSMVVRDRGNGEPLPEHPAQRLIKQPNREMSESDFLRWIITNLKLAGVVYLQKVKNGKGEVLELWPVRSDYVRPQLEDNKGITGYRVVISGVEQDTIPPEDMIVLRLPDPLNMFDRMSPIEVLSRSADVDNSLTDLIKIILQKGAMPLGILASKLRLNDDAISDVRRRWEDRYGGYTNWTTPAVLDSDMSYQRIGMTMDEMKFGDVDGRNETRICMVLRVPPIIIGATEGLARSTFSNYESARKQWWEDVLSALYKSILDALVTQLFVPDFGLDIIVEWDFSKVPALQEERNARWQRATNAAKGGVITVNMALKEMGLPTVGNEGDVFLRSTTVTAVPNNTADDEAEAGDVGTVTEEDDADEETVSAEGKSLEYKGLETDEQRKWFFANNPSFASEGSMPKFEEGDTAEQRQQKFEDWAEHSKHPVVGSLWDHRMIDYDKTGKIVVRPENVKEAARRLVVDHKDATLPRDYLVGLYKEQRGLEGNIEHAEGKLNREKAQHAQSIALAAHLGNVKLTPAQHEHVSSVAEGNYLKGKYSQYASGDRGTLQGPAKERGASKRSDYAEHMRQVHREEFAEVRRKSEAPELEGKSLTSAGAESAIPADNRVHGKPLAKDEATKVDDYKQAEIDDLVKLYNGLKHGKTAKNGKEKVAA